MRRAGVSIRLLKNHAVFLDRDGTLIEEREYLKDPKQVAFYPGAVGGLEKLRDAGFKLFLVTNQSGVGRGYFTLTDMQRVHDHITDELARSGVTFEKIYFAPEHPDQPSRGRKPSPQFLFDARDEFGVDLAQSYMIGDKLIDLECGWNAGVRKSILVRTGYGARTAANSSAVEKACVCETLSEAADWIGKEK